MQVADGKLSPEKALHCLGQSPFEQLACGLNLDHHRALRTGLGEVVFAQGKSTPNLLAAVENLAKYKNGTAEQKTLATKVSPAQGEALINCFPEGEFWVDASLFCLGTRLDLAPPWSAKGEVLIVTAGAADLPVGLEALGTAHFFKLDAGLITDVGIAGIHRLLPHLENLSKAKVIIAVAGMEGALPGVLASLLPCPVIAVPSSVGYGVSTGGMAALMGMLASCAPGLSVMNINNGFGATAFAAKMLRNI